MIAQDPVTEEHDNHVDTGYSDTLSVRSFLGGPAFLGEGAQKQEDCQPRT